ncbi:MAG: asparagine synthase (glutamine-hydrolyzing) [Candidatus Omnitrophica bacterium]|nr:asparagine synthase (glutamine-hydrolyzing) [Candidatus Omnitrophota bacterium]
MCGIAGIVDAAGGPVDKTLLRRMTSALAHRGPDAEGYYFNPAARLGSGQGQISAAFGHRRLKVIDLDAGIQPMGSPDESLWIVFNGEIYNYKELREELIARGRSFRTKSDTEVILQAYEEQGPDCVTRFRGMFAFALWDQKRQRLMLARDRLGKKPLVYTHQNGRLIFSSQMDSLLQHPDLKSRLDAAAIHHYLTFMCVPAPRTAFEGIRKLPPAHYALYDGRQLQITRYWNLNFHTKRKIQLDEAVCETQRLLEESVRLRLRSDVPLGVLLSGGVDSSAVVSIASRLANRRIKTFSIGFEESQFNELPHAGVVARRFNTDHREQIVRPDASSVIPTLVRQFGEPFADSSALPTYYLAEMARREVTVVLNGDGGDEAFGGYYRQLAMRLADCYGDLPAWLRRGLLDPVLGSWPDRLAFANGRMSPKRFFQGASRPRAERWVSWIGLFSEEEKRRLYTPFMRTQTGAEDSAELMRLSFRGLEELDGVDAALAVDTSFYLPNDLLVKMDICSMAHGLEARSPLLDQVLLEFTASLPGRMKVPGRTLKFLLKETQKEFLPADHLNRPKQGFAIPVAQWFRDPLRQWLEGILLSDTANLHAYIRKEGIKTLVDQHTSGMKDHGHRLWALLMLELWLQQFIDERPRVREDSAVAETGRLP